MLWFYVADRTTTFPQGVKVCFPAAVRQSKAAASRALSLRLCVQSYSRDLLAFLFCILTLVAWITSNKPGRGSLLLNRPQTEEWKGWMQVCLSSCVTQGKEAGTALHCMPGKLAAVRASAAEVRTSGLACVGELRAISKEAITDSALQVLFLLYHYFEAREMYNAIRVFIAGYVWMTGYNNFSYYYKYKDFNVARCACCLESIWAGFCAAGGLHGFAAQQALQAEHAQTSNPLAVSLAVRDARAPGLQHRPSCTVLLHTCTCRALTCSVQVLPDDVAPELPGGRGVRGAAQQLHAVLHLPHAHHLHHLRLRCSGPGPPPQRVRMGHPLKVHPPFALRACYALVCSAEQLAGTAAV